METIRSCALENFVLQSRGLREGSRSYCVCGASGFRCTARPPAHHAQPRLVLAHVRRKSEFVERQRRRCLNTTRSRGTINSSAARAHRHGGGRDRGLYVNEAGGEGIRKFHHGTPNAAGEREKPEIIVAK